MDRKSNSGKDEVVVYFEHWIWFNISLSLWDTAGQETFGCIRVLAYDNTDILLIAFCVMERTSFANVKELWYKEYEKNKKKFSNAKVKFKCSEICVLSSKDFDVL